MPVSAGRMPKDATGAETLTDHETPPAFRVIGEAFKTYILVAHNGIARVVESYFRDMTNEEYAAWGVKNCEIVRYNF